MTNPVPSGRITAGFDQPRPLSVPPDQRDHKHGAIDLAAPVGTSIIAPEDGALFYFCAIRSGSARSFSEIDLSGVPFDFAGHGYFYDVYGALSILLGRSGMTHIMAHSYLNQLFNDAPVRVPWEYKESPVDERWPVCSFYSLSARAVREGTKIAEVGNAGYSTGAHCHYEVHHGSVWERHADRVRPITLFD